MTGFWGPYPQTYQSRTIWRISILGDKKEVGKEHFEYVYLPSSCWQQGISWTWTKLIFTCPFLSTPKRSRHAKKSILAWGRFFRDYKIDCKSTRNFSLCNASWNMKPFLNLSRIPNSGQFNCEVRAGSVCTYYPFNHPFFHHLIAQQNPIIKSSQKQSS